MSTTIEDVVNRTQQNLEGENSQWPDPIPLTPGELAPLPYPVDIMPPVMRNAVLAYQRFGQQPLAMVASSALACAALVSQPLANVARDANLTGPCSLYFLSIAQSGERKSACDKRMSRAMRQWQAQQREQMASDIDKARASLDSWQARRDGFLARIKKLAGSTKPEAEADCRQLESDLERHEGQKPFVPAVPEIFLEDVTPEALAVRLATGWPSSSLWSDEGGLVIGSAGMSEEAALRFVSLLNRLWDGNPFERRRTVRESVEVIGRRFCSSIMMQPDVAQRLCGLGDGVARGTGNLARFLIAWPQSTIGHRPYKPGNIESPELQAFDKRVEELLGQVLPVRDSLTMILEPPTLHLSKDAFDCWRAFHDDVENELQTDGEFSELRDFGAKCAEQAARIACVLHIFEHGPVGEISLTSMEAGAAISTWHLQEAGRLFANVAGSQVVEDAKLLLSWLQSNPASTLQVILQRGPGRLRKKPCRDAALEILKDHGLCRTEKLDGKSVIVLNPTFGAMK